MPVLHGHLRWERQSVEKCHRKTLRQIGVRFEGTAMKPCTYRVAHVSDEQMVALTTQFQSPCVRTTKASLFTVDRWVISLSHCLAASSQANKSPLLCQNKMASISARSVTSPSAVRQTIKSAGAKIPALSVHIKSLIFLHQPSLPVQHSRDRLNLKMDSYTEHFDFITTRD